MSKIKSTLVTTALLGIGVVGAVALYDRITVRKYRISGNFPGMGSVRIAHLSDMHSTICQQLISILKKQSPDIIVFTGDIVDDRRGICNILEFLTEFARIAPCFYVCGNHEALRFDRGALYKVLDAIGITVLHSKSTLVTVGGGSVILMGIQDPRDYMISCAKGDDGCDPLIPWEDELFHVCLEANSLAQRGGEVCLPRILLSHRPEYSNSVYASLPVDIVLSGHAHGGQVRVPFLINGLYATNQGVFPKFAGGLYVHNRDRGQKALFHAVSRGLDRTAWRPRIFNRREVVIVDIDCAK